METKQKDHDVGPALGGRELRDLQVGNQRGAVKRRLVDMGLTPGTVVTLVKIAPLRGPHGAAAAGV